MKVYAITIEDAYGEYGRLYALADNDSDSKEWPRLKLWATTWKPVSVR